MLFFKLKKILRDNKLESLLNNEDYKPCNLRIEEVMSDKPRKYSETGNPNIYIGT